MNIAATGLGSGAGVRAAFCVALSRPNLTLLLNTDVMKTQFQRDSLCRRQNYHGRCRKDIAADEVILAAGAVNSQATVLWRQGKRRRFAILGRRRRGTYRRWRESQDHVLLSGVVFPKLQRQNAGSAGRQQRSRGARGLLVERTFG